MTWQESQPATGAEMRARGLALGTWTAFVLVARDVLAVNDQGRRHNPQSLQVVAVVCSQDDQAWHGWNVLHRWRPTQRRGAR